MKNKILLLAFCCCPFISLSQQLTQEEIVAFSNTLQKVTNEAVLKQQPEQIHLYYATYDVFRTYYNPTEGCNQYFREIRATYLNNPNKKNLSVSSSDPEFQEKGKMKLKFSSPSFIHQPQ